MTKNNERGCEVSLLARPSSTEFVEFVCVAFGWRDAPKVLMSLVQAAGLLMASKKVIEVTELADQS